MPIKALGFIIPLLFFLVMIALAVGGFYNVVTTVNHNRAMVDKIYQMNQEYMQLTEMVLEQSKRTESLLEEIGKDIEKEHSK